MPISRPKNGYKASQSLAWVCWRGRERSHGVRASRPSKRRDGGRLRARTPRQHDSWPTLAALRCLVGPSAPRDGAEPARRGHWRPRADAFARPQSAASEGRTGAGRRVGPCPSTESPAEGVPLREREPHRTSLHDYHAATVHPPKRRRRREVGSRARRRRQIRQSFPLAASASGTRHDEAPMRGDLAALTRLHSPCYTRRLAPSAVASSGSFWLRASRSHASSWEPTVC